MSAVLRVSDYANHPLLHEAYDAIHVWRIAVWTETRGGNIKSSSDSSDSGKQTNIVGRLPWLRGGCHDAYERRFAMLEVKQQFPSPNNANVE